MSAEGKLKTDRSTDLVVEVVRSLLEGYTRHHRDLKIDGKSMGSIVALQISANRDDQPYLVGRNGQHLAAMNEIMFPIGRRLRRTIVLSLQEPKVGDKLPPRKFETNADWKPDETRKLLNLTLKHVLRADFKIDEHHDENVSVFQIVPARSDEPLLTPALESALDIIFDAIGKANGRTVHVAGLAPQE